MDYLLLGIASCCVALLTFFSGFGLGSLLLPAFAFFFPLELAVAATAMVHLANNLFKLALMGRFAHLKVAMTFGLPAALASFAGANALLGLSHFEPLFDYTAMGAERSVEPLALAMGALIIVFALLDLWPRTREMSFPTKVMPLGGLLSGFFGGLSGHQGALRAAFLIKAGLDRNAFIGTSVVCAVMVDLVRLSVYGSAYLGGSFLNREVEDGRALGPLVLTAVLCAFAGSFLGKKLLHKVTLKSVQTLVGLLLLLLGGAIGAGLL
ncbi:MAG: sulfite exporter TauE/SafE family protein [Deltaproteobacteria bacterium]|nr:sulfite exporter TauE/SafE family protein [Deltaproteobacteria bacterium]